MDGIEIESRSHRKDSVMDKKVGFPTTTIIAIIFFSTMVGYYAIAKFNSAGIGNNRQACTWILSS
jgi:hypothetical protein